MRIEDVIAPRDRWDRIADDPRWSTPAARFSVHVLAIQGRYLNEIGAASLADEHFARISDTFPCEILRAWRGEGWAASDRWPTDHREALIGLMFDGGSPRGAEVWFAGRVVYLPLYLFGVPWLRTAAYGVSLAGLTMMFTRLL